jgi:OTU domain-containing protein 6
MVSLEEEYAAKLQEMEHRHQEELTAVQKELDETNVVVVVDTNNDEQVAPNPEDIEKERRERKREKARCKLLQKREQETQLLLEQKRDLEGPSARKQELELLIQEQLEPLQLEIIPVASDGHCLYRAVAEQCDPTRSYLELRTYHSYILSLSRRQFQYDIIVY